MLRCSVVELQALEAGSGQEPLDLLRCVGVGLSEIQALGQPQDTPLLVDHSLDEALEESVVVADPPSEIIYLCIEARTPAGP